MRRVLVTGGAGFLGSHLCRRLWSDGAHVVALDSLLTGSRRNLADLLGHPRFELVEHDVTAPYDVPVDRVYNLASAASPPRYQRDPVHTLLSNVMGTRHALENALRHGARVLQASTSEVYGDPDVHPQREDYRGNVSCTGPRACYDEGKRAAEALVFDYARGRGADVRVARIFNTYGPAMDPEDGRVVSNFVTRALAGRELTVYGDGTQTRSLCYVSDMVEGLVRLMEHPTALGPVNLGNPTELTVLRVAELVLERVGRGRIGFAPLPEDDPRRRRPDIARARRHLGFVPSVTFEAGLAPTVAYFAARADAARSGMSAVV